ncbi:hypothetical protein CC80DRAFT_300811 [Byssothecium circinans]|uniref:Uncharacterized protein n=1 Tax=Byssothecium circinans TaxID=147558 RepID=A0A6A5T9Y9_9PLEO|nr:hypothetical protein CC80DRAFT_300811 [Byssothecium circinans]
MEWSIEAIIALIALFAACVPLLVFLYRRIRQRYLQKRDINISLPTYTSSVPSFTRPEQHPDEDLSSPVGGRRLGVPRLYVMRRYSTFESMIMVGEHDEVNRGMR